MTGAEIGIVLAAAGALTSAVGAIQQGQAAKEQARFNAAISERNALISEQEAEIARRNAAVEEETLRRRQRLLRGSQRAAAGASGLELEGSPLLLVAEAAAEGEVEVLAIRFAGTVDEQRALSQAAIDRLNADALRLKGARAQTAGFLTAGASLLTGGAKIASRFKKDGTLGD